jgi:hypothetical protein
VLGSGENESWIGREEKRRRCVRKADEVAGAYVHRWILIRQLEVELATGLGVRGECPFR